MTVATTEARQTGAEHILWDLSVFYQGIDDPALTADMARVGQMADAFVTEYKGKVAGLDAEGLMDAMTAMDAINDLAGRVGYFAGLTYSVDTVNPQYGALLQKVTEFGAQVDQKLIFWNLEWSALPDEQAKALLADPTISPFRHKLDSDRRFKPFQLSEIEEQLLLEKSVTGDKAWTRLFTQLIAAIRVDWDGTPITLTPALNKLHDADPDVRKRAGAAITAALKGKSMELTYIFNVLAADKASEDARRQYPSWISYRNLDNKAPDAVVEALIQAVTSNYEMVARHYTLKRKLLGLEKLTENDRYAPLKIANGDRFYTWDQARETVLKAFEAFHPDFAGAARRFFDENWIHAPVLPGKRGGAFCSYTVASAHPFVFLNYEGKARDVMTLAHELGHGIHAYLSGRAHGNVGMSTPLTTAEMASTFGERLVFRDLMANEPDPAVRLAMLAQKIEDSFATVFRQTSMNRFEDAYHTARRTEGELPPEKLSAIWLRTQRAMFGDSVELSDDYGVWWSYIPHFLNTPGYVYAYAFGELLVLALFKLYEARGAAFVPQFLAVLEAGDSDWPEAILAKVGVDLTDLTFWNQGLAAIRELVDEEERLAKAVYGV
jgi:oligoendopeptidase F